MSRLAISSRGRIHYDNSDKLSLTNGSIFRDEQAAAGTEAGTISEGATADDGFISNSIVAAELSDGSVASAIYAGTAAASAGILDSVVGAEGEVPTISAIGITLESVQAQLLVEALAQASAAILNAAQTGEAWVSSLSGLLGEIQAAAQAADAFDPSGSASATIDAIVSAGEAWTSVLAGVETAQFSEATQASEAFFSAAQTIASIIETASAGEVVIALAQALCNLSEAANASDSFTSILAGLLGEWTDGAVFSDETIAIAQAFGNFTGSGTFSDVFDSTEVAAPLGEVLLAISADSLFAAATQAGAGLGSAVIAGDVFIALEPSTVIGRLIIGSISIQATLIGIPSVN